MNNSAEVKCSRPSTGDHCSSAGMYVKACMHNSVVWFHTSTACIYREFWRNKHSQTVRQFTTLIVLVLLLLECVMEVLCVKKTHEYRCKEKNVSYHNHLNCLYCYRPASTWSKTRIKLSWHWSASSLARTSSLQSHTHTHSLWGLINAPNDSSSCMDTEPRRF